MEDAVGVFERAEGVVGLSAEVGVREALCIPDYV